MAPVAPRRDRARAAVRIAVEGEANSSAVPLRAGHVDRLGKGLECLDEGLVPRLPATLRLRHFWHVGIILPQEGACGPATSVPHRRTPAPRRPCGLPLSTGTVGRYAAR